MDLFLIFFCSIAIIFFLMLFYKISKSNSGKERMESNLRTQKDENGKTDFVRCPLCSTPLAKNEDMFSRIYRPMTTADQRMTVHGCPHCYPRPEPGVKRSCPVCGKEGVDSNEECFTCLNCGSTYTLEKVLDKEMIWIKSLRRKY